uniref:Uncharacterized protein n=1 Tax=Parascaris univalens TaxID=6257 RepID=A0A915A265_PARUN
MRKKQLDKLNDARTFARIFFHNCLLTNGKDGISIWPHVIHAYLLSAVETKLDLECLRNPAILLTTAEAQERCLSRNLALLSAESI